MSNSEKTGLDDLEHFDEETLVNAEVNLGGSTTEDDLAKRFTLLHGDRWRYMSVWNKWMLWDTKRWKSEDTLKIYDLIRKICREIGGQLNRSKKTKILSATTMAAVERIVRSDRKHAATVDQWDADSWLLNTQDGIIDLRTSNLIPSDPTRYLTKVTLSGVGNSCPLWKRFLDEITQGEKSLQGYLKRMFGYCLTGSTREQALFYLYGRGKNGKTVLGNVSQRILGDYSTAAPSSMFMESKNSQHPTELAKLMGARLVLAAEVSENARWDEVRIKTLTGGDRISARFMRQDFFDYVPQFKIVIYGNNKPALSHVDEAIRRRFHIVPFNYQVPEEKRDKDLEQKLMCESPGILQWMIEGAREWYEQGLNPPKIVLDETELYFDDQDLFGKWKEEYCVEFESAQTETMKLFEFWKKWAELAGVNQIDIKKFIAEFEKRGFKRGQSVLNRRSTIKGIGLRENDGEGV